MSDIMDSVKKYVEGHKENPEIISFEEYLEKVRKNPVLAANAHKRLYDMIKSYGVEDDKDTGEEKYLFFEQQLFGIEDSTKQISEYFKGAALGSDVSRRFLLLYGPPSSGKSNLVNMIKDAFEEWTRKDDGAIYGIEGCPMNEEPLHLFPASMRSQVEKELKAKIEGELCPVCALKLRDAKGDFSQFKVKRIYASQQGRTAIGTFVPGDSKSQDVSELVGSVDLSKIGEFGTESDPRAYRFDGELNISNRGMMEFIEILKCVSPDTYVFTNKGILQIKELGLPCKNSLLDMDMLTADGMSRTSKAIYRGSGETRRVSTLKGFSIEGALDHRVKVMSKDGLVWKEIRSLISGDWVCINRSGGYWPEEAPSMKKYIPEMKYGGLGRPFKHIDLPVRLTLEFARLLGYFVSEGWYISRDQGIGIATENDFVISDLKIIAKSLGIEAINRGRCQWGLYSVLLARLFKNLGLTGRVAKEKHVPEIIRVAPKEFVSAFLRAYFDGDGTCGLFVSATTASPKLAEQLQMILLNYGIISKHDLVFNKEYKRYYHTVQIDSSNVDCFVKEIGFGIPYKMDAARQLTLKDHDEHRDGLPCTEKYWNEIHEGLKNLVLNQRESDVPYLERKGVRQLIGDMNYEQIFRFATGRSIPSKKVAKKLMDIVRPLVGVPQGLDSILESGLFFDKVVSVKKGQSELWDFHVPQNHNYIGNGFVNHNCDIKFLYVLLTATQEKNIKTPRFPLLSCDEVILAHTNEQEYKDFVGQPKNEALIDRMIVCRVKYNLRVKDEIKIYEKLLGHPADLHVAPHTLKIAAIFSVLSRLEDPKDKTLDKVKKMKLYNGEDVEGVSKADIPRLKRECPNEGMDGVSPRYVINRLITTSIKGADVPGKQKWMTPIDVIRSLKEGLETSSKFKPEDKTKYDELLGLVKAEFDHIARNEVQKAFFVSFEEESQALLNNYIDNVEAYLEETKMEDPLTHEEIEPDEKLMRSIEGKIGISEEAKDSFRNEVMRKVAAALRRGEKFHYENHTRLREAIEKQMFEDRRDTIKMTITSRTKEPEELKRIDVVIKTLCDKHGYIPESAKELLEYVSSMMAREK